MTSSKKFLFDTSFDPPDVLTRTATAIRRPAEPTFSRADLDAAHAAGLAEGRAAAFAEAADSSEQRAAAALDLIASQVRELVASRSTLSIKVQRDALAVIRTVIRKIVPALCRKDPLAEIDELVTRVLRDAMDEPRLVLRVCDDLFDPVQQRLAPLAEACGFSGKLVLLADSALADGDCHIEWADGGIERNSQCLLHDIDAALARLDPAPAGTPIHASGDPS